MTKRIFRYCSNCGALETATQATLRKDPKTDNLFCDACWFSVVLPKKGNGEED